MSSRGLSGINRYLGATAMRLHICEPRSTRQVRGQAILTILIILSNKTKLYVVCDYNCLGDLAHRFPRVHALELNSAEGLVLFKAVLIDKDSLGTLHCLSGL